MTGRAARHWSVSEAEQYLREGVQISRADAEEWMRRSKGVIHQPMLGGMLEELMAGTAERA